MNAMGGTRFVTRSVFIVASNPIEYFGTILATFSLMQIAIAFTTSLFTNITINLLDGNYGDINLIMAAICAVSLVFPVCIAFLRWPVWKYSRQKMADKTQMENEAFDDKINEINEKTGNMEKF